MPAHRNGPRHAANNDRRGGAGAVRGGADPFASAFGFSGQPALGATEEFSRNAEAMAQCGAILARGFQDIAREWFGLAQDRMQRNLEGLGMLAHCRSLPDLLAAQVDLMRDNLDAMINNGRRIAELSVQVASEAAQAVAQAEQEVAATAVRNRRAA
jgi:phasin family protein